MSALSLFYVLNKSSELKASSADSRSQRTKMGGEQLQGTKTRGEERKPTCGNGQQQQVGIRVFVSFIYSTTTLREL